MSIGLILGTIFASESAKPVDGAIVGLGPIIYNGSSQLVICEEDGKTKINPHATTSDDGIFAFFFFWDSSTFGDSINSNPTYTLNIMRPVGGSGHGPYSHTFHASGSLNIGVNLADVYSGRLSLFRSSSSVLIALGKSYLKYIDSKIPQLTSMGLKAGKLSPDLYGLFAESKIYAPL